MDELEELYTELHEKLKLKEKLAAYLVKRIAKLQQRIVKLKQRIDYLECQLDIDE